MLRGWSSEARTATLSRGGLFFCIGTIIGFAAPLVTEKTISMPQFYLNQ